MKTTLASTAIASALCLILGCSHSRPRSVVVAPPPPPPAMPEAKAEAAPEEVLAAPVLKDPPALSPELAKVLEMYESGVSSEVLLAHVEQSAQPLGLTPDQIIYFHDLGVPDSVVTALISSGPAVKQAVSEPEAPPAAVESQPAAAQTVVVKEVKKRPRISNEVFYSTLSPYGTWFHLDGHGWVWQPTVATVNSSWRPYYDRGSWIYCDAGWYWRSDYSWGWAPFHYGRWSLHAHHGWFWVPDPVWGPSWVTFRYTGSYCGWAPLPPRARFRTGIGITWHGSRISAGFGFGLSHRHYAFVHRGHFGRRHEHRRGLDRRHAEQVYNESTVINNYIVGDNNTIVNQGISRDRLTGGRPEQIRKVALRDVGDARHIDRGSQDGGSLRVYRPKISRVGGAPNATVIRQQSDSPSYRTIAYRKAAIASSAKSPSAPPDKTPSGTRPVSVGRSGNSSPGSRPQDISGSPGSRNSLTHFRSAATPVRLASTGKSQSSSYRSNSQDAQASPASQGAIRHRSTPAPVRQASPVRTASPRYRSNFQGDQSSPASRGSTIRYRSAPAPARQASTGRTAPQSYRSNSQDAQASSASRGPTTRYRSAPAPARQASTGRTAPQSYRSNSQDAASSSSIRYSTSSRNSSPSKARTAPSSRTRPSTVRSSSSQRSSSQSISRSAPSRRPSTSVSRSSTPSRSSAPSRPSSVSTSRSRSSSPSRASSSPSRTRSSPSASRSAPSSRSSPSPRSSR